MATLNYRRFTCLLIVITILGAPCSGGRRCGHTGDYGDDCTFVPAPPGHTPACAAPGYTYCEQLDYYPNNLIRHLVDKGEYDFSTLLNDETREEFSATRPTQGPYGYGPHSLSGTQGISLVTEKPAYYPKQPQYHGQDQFQAHDQYQNNGPYQTQFPNRQQTFAVSKGSSLPPPSGYVGYYTPSLQHRPISPTYLPSRESYLTPKSSNASLATGNTAPFFRGNFPAGINLDQYGDFWRGNSYFEVPKPTPFSNTNFHVRNFASQADYFNNNGPSPYYSTPSDSASPYYKAVSSGQDGWSASGKRQQQFPYGVALRQAVTPFNPNDWWQRYSNDYRRSDELPFKPVDTNDIKPRTVAKRDTSKIKKPKILRSQKSKNPFFDQSKDITLSRKKRQSQGTGGEQLCPTRSQYIMPKAALNKQGNWMYVVNMGESMDNMYSQLVKSEVCVSQTCNGICSLPLGYTSQCEQRYVQKRLVALDQGGQRLYTDVFWFPSCCLCTISNNQT